MSEQKPEEVPARKPRRRNHSKTYTTKKRKNKTAKESRRRNR